MKNVMLAFLVALALLVPRAEAGTYPDKPVKVLVHSGAGGLLDLSARLAASMLSESLGQPFLVTNMPGGEGSVAVNTMLAAEPDGYTLLVSSSSVLLYSPKVKKSRYALEDFAVLGRLVFQNMGYITQPDRPWKDLRDAFEWAKRENRPLTVGVLNDEDRGIVEEVARFSGAKISAVPQTSGNAALTAILGGHLDVAVLGPYVENYQAGKIKLLAVQGTTRSAFVPDVPTLLELGYPVANDSYFVLSCASSVPAEVRQTLEKALAGLGTSEAYKEQVQNRLKMLPVPTDAASAAEAFTELDKQIRARLGS